MVGMARNQNPKQWSLRWEVSEADGDTIETFLNDRATDNASFDWDRFCLAIQNKRNYNLTPSTTE